MTLHIIRHAEKQSGDFYDADHKHNNPPISSKGASDSKQLFRYFKDKNITSIYVSAYFRTLQTIEYTAAALGLLPRVDATLNEIDNGSWETLTEVEIQNGFPRLWKRYTEQFGDFRFPDGETGEEAQMRAREFLDRIKYAEDHVIAVSHDGLIRCLACYVLGIPVYKRSNFKVDTCGITEIDYSEATERWTLIRFNQQVVL